MRQLKNFFVAENLTVINICKKERAHGCDKILNPPSIEMKIDIMVLLDNEGS